MSELENDSLAPSRLVAMPDFEFALSRSKVGITKAQYDHYLALANLQTGETTSQLRGQLREPPVLTAFQNELMTIFSPRADQHLPHAIKVMKQMERYVSLAGHSSTTTNAMRRSVAIPVVVVFISLAVSFPSIL